MSWMRLRVMLTVCCLFAAGGVGTADAHARSPRSGGARARSYSHSPEFGRSSALAAGSLTTDQAADPLGIDTATPQLGWVINSSASGLSQSSYEIRVATDERSLANGHNLVWDSGQVSSRRSFDISYAGSALASQTRYYWEVRVRDNHGNASQWSRPAWFETAFLDSSSSRAVGSVTPTRPRRPDPSCCCARRSRSATRRSPGRACTSGPELPYTDIDGHPVSSNVLDTAFTEYGKSSPWQVEQGSLHAAGGEIGILKQGTDWTDYTMSFDTTPVANQAGCGHPRFVSQHPLPADPGHERRHRRPGQLSAGGRRPQRRVQHDQERRAPVHRLGRHPIRGQHDRLRDVRNHVDQRHTGGVL